MSNLKLANLPRFSIFLIVTLFCHAYAADKHPLEWKQGDSWKYRWVDLWTNSEKGTVEKTVLEATPAGYRTSYQGKAGTQEEFVKFDATHVLPMPPVVSGTAGTYDALYIKLPLIEGAKWSFADYWSSQYGNAIVKNDLNCEAKGREEITVPAGTYKSQRVECSGPWKSFSSGAGGRSEYVLWYSPDAKWIVRWRQKSWMGGSLQQQEEFSLVETSAR